MSWEDMTRRGVEPKTYEEATDEIRNRADNAVQRGSDVDAEAASQRQRMVLQSRNGQAEATESLLVQTEEELQALAINAPDSPRLESLRLSRDALNAELIRQKTKANQETEQREEVGEARDHVEEAYGPEGKTKIPEDEAGLIRYENSELGPFSPDKVPAFADFLRARLKMLEGKAARLGAEQGKPLRFPDTMGAIVGRGEASKFFVQALGGTSTDWDAIEKKFSLVPFSQVADRLGINLDQEFPNFRKTFFNSRDRR